VSLNASAVASTGALHFLSLRAQRRNLHIPFGHGLSQISWVFVSNSLDYIR
jgi:hypothetical protein